MQWHYLLLDQNPRIERDNYKIESFVIVNRKVVNIYWTFMKCTWFNWDQCNEDSDQLSSEILGRKSRKSRFPP